MAAKRKAAKPKDLGDIIDRVLREFDVKPTVRSNNQQRANVAGRSAVKTVAKVPMDAAKWWYGSSPKDVAINSAIGAMPIGKGIKAAVKGAKKVIPTAAVVLSPPKAKVKPKPKKSSGSTPSRKK
jgi:hypothetical protein